LGAVAAKDENEARPLLESVVNAPVLGVVAPTDVPLIEPPVRATLENVDVPLTVMFWNVGDGYVWASATSGAKSTAIRSFFIVVSGDGDYATVVPNDASGRRL
jgi:hypothetical protein